MCVGKLFQGKMGRMINKVKVEIFGVEQKGYRERSRSKKCSQKEYILS